MEYFETPFGRIFQNWPYKPLSEVVFFQEGPGLRNWQWSESGMKVINVGNILLDGTVDINNTNRYISMGEFEKRYRHYAVEDGDIVVSSSGFSYGKVGRIDAHHLPLMMNTSVIRFHPLNYWELNPDYLYAFLRSSFFSNQIEQFVIISSRPNFGPTHLKQMYILVPPLETQRKIAVILSAYDDLIENNTRRIKLLEQAAHDLYREWFVEFRFPGHEQVPLVESEMGLIPQGWEASTVKGLSSYINRGISPQYDEEAECIVINQKCIRDGRLNLDLVRRNAKPVPIDKFVHFGDVLINSTGEGTLGRVAQVYQEIANCTVDSHVSIVRPSSNSLIDYLGLALIAMQERLALMGEGATNQTELSRSRISGLDLLLPSSELLGAFTEAITPLRQNVILLMKKNAILRETRDLLLPRLVSGELDVEELDIVT
ncbi:MAG: restriction endonuclease subunit S [Anaerolineae bacterium]|nr:restriction endonuclease subunit S [Anaerolineae bacterium]